MADQLYLSLWFPNFRLAGLGPALVGVLGQVASAGGASAVTAAAVYPISWNEAPVYQRVYDEADGEAAQPESAVAEAMEMLHEDYAYEFEVKWDLWVPETGGGLDTLWRQEPRALRVTGFGPEFDQGSYELNGHIRIDFGTDAPFLQEDVTLEAEAATHVQQNVQKLIDVTQAIQNNLAVSSRLLWSESGESLAEKLIARLQRLN
ncbi:MAG TPA: hypothetical protein VGM02_02455 [Acidobacteriaceae bacterium]